MVLSDRDIRKAIKEGRLVIDPYEDTLVQPASIDLRLGSKFLIFKRTQQPFIAAENPYGSKGLGSKYQGQNGPMVSQFYRNYRADSNPGTGVRKRSSENSALREWLQTSQYKGSVTLFANALNVPLKTVEDWVYGRSKPSLQHWSRLYDATGLPEYQQLLDTKG